MDNVVIVAVLSLIGTLSGSWMGVRQTNKLVDFRIKQLEDKVDKHNNLVERVALVEASAKSAHKRMDEIVEKEKNHD